MSSDNVKRKVNQLGSALRYLNSRIASYILKLRNKSLALFNVFLEVRQAGCEEFLFLCRDLSDGVDRLNTVKLSGESMKRIQPKFKRGLTPSSTFEEKKSMPWAANNGLLTNVGVMTPFSPFNPLKRELVNVAPAYAIERVALPAPSFALTTSSPPNWIR